MSVTSTPLVATKPEAPRLRVLLVEDENDSARYVQRKLETYPGASFDVVHVEDLESALSQLGRDDFDVMVLDLELPDGDGMGMVKDVCSLAAAMPVVILTAHEDAERARMAVCAGAQDYLVKQQQTGTSMARSIVHAVERFERTRRQIAPAAT